METSLALAPFLEEGFMGDALSAYDSEMETETEAELETEGDSDAGPSIHRPRVRVVDDSEPATPEFEVEVCRSLLLPLSILITLS
jgi:hypothetical protein